MNQLLARGVFVLLLSISLIALTLPMRVSAAPQPVKMSCCAHAGDHAADNHCNHEAPQKSDEAQQCCAACAIGLTLFVTAREALIFSADRGDKLIGESAGKTSRLEQPPVPPPRALLA